MAIQGKVARILNDRDLVINRGSGSDVKVGMIFVINEPTIEITDPDSGMPLGSVAREKIRVKIYETAENFSIGKTYETYVSESLGISFPGLRAPTKVRTLRVDQSATSVSFSDDEGIALVNVGDTVIEIGTAA